jgi:hypothetical protein
MQAEHIRKLLKRRPFKPVELLSDGGEKLIIYHPEAVLLGKEMVVAEQPDGTMDYIEAENVSKVRVLRFPPPRPPEGGQAPGESAMKGLSSFPHPRTPRRSPRSSRTPCREPAAGPVHQSPNKLLLENWVETR